MRLASIFILVPFLGCTGSMSGVDAGSSLTDAGDDLPPACPSPPEDASICDDSCDTATNDECEDFDSDIGPATCVYGTDCSDCGPRAAPHVCTEGFVLVEQDLVDLAGFNCVEGDVAVDQTSLENLDAFQNINFVDGDLLLDGNVGLTSLTGLERLRGVGGDFLVRGSPELADFCALEGLSSAGTLTISGLDGLETLAGLTAFSGSGGIAFEDNPRLRSLVGFAPRLSAIDGALVIRDNPMLRDLDFTFVEAIVVGGLELDNNDSVQNMDWLSGLLWLEGPLVISDNAELADLSGLEALIGLDGDAFTVTNNPKLPTSQVDDLLERLVAEGFDGEITIEGNG